MKTPPDLGIECEPGPGCGSRNGCALWAFGVFCPAGRVASIECVAHPRVQPAICTFSPGSIPSGRSPPCPKMPAPSIAGGVGADDLHRGTVVVAEPDRVAAAEECAPTSAHWNPWSSSTSAPTLTHRTIGVGAAVGEPADGASRGAPARPRRRHQRRRGDPRWSPHAGDPKRRRPVRASISPFLISVHSSPNSGRVEPRSGAGCASGFRGAGAVLRCSTAPAEPRFSDAEIPNRSNLITARDHGHA